MLHECDNCHTRTELDGIRPRGTYRYCAVCGFPEWHWPVQGAIRERPDLSVLRHPRIPHNVHQWASAKRT